MNYQRYHRRYHLNRHPALARLPAPPRPPRSMLVTHPNVVRPPDHGAVFTCNFIKKPRIYRAFLLRKCLRNVSE
jgi:hypothetical protein